MSDSCVMPSVLSGPIYTFDSFQDRCPIGTMVSTVKASTFFVDNSAEKKRRCRKYRCFQATSLICLFFRQSLNYLINRDIFSLEQQPSENIKAFVTLTLRQASRCKTCDKDAYSTPMTSGVCQPKCCPPSTQSNCPVTPGASRK